MIQNDNKIRHLLDRYAGEYNTPSFIGNDPVQFPRKYTDKRDIEITALLVSTISWGKRAMILRNADKMLGLMHNEPYRFVTEGDFSEISSQNIHRTFFSRHLIYYLNGLREIYKHYPSLEDFAVASGAVAAEAPAWELAKDLNAILCDANGNKTEEASRCLPSKPESSALKRLNMALRWLIRNDGIVDIGCWTAIRPDRLYIPLDVHVGNISRRLGLLTRQQNDRKAVIELTDTLRRYRPDDPTVYDFALFGLGVSGEAANNGILIPEQ